MNKQKQLNKIIKLQTPLLFEIKKLTELLKSKIDLEADDIILLEALYSFESYLETYFNYLLNFCPKNIIGKDNK